MTPKLPTGIRILLLIVAGLASAALFYFGTGLHPIWWTLWLAPVPVLAIAPRLHREAALLLGSIICRRNTHQQRRADERLPRI